MGFRGLLVRPCQANGDTCASQKVLIKKITQLTIAIARNLVVIADMDMTVHTAIAWHAAFIL